MKTWLVIKREYWTRVRKKTFILVTLLVPILMAAFFAVMVGMQMWSKDYKKIGVLDQSMIIAPHLESNKEVEYITLQSISLEDAKAIDSLDAVLEVPAFSIADTASFYVHSKAQFGLGSQQRISKDVNAVLINKRLQDAGVDAAQIDALKRETITIRTIDKEGKESKSQLAMIIGYVSGILLYMFMFFYGMNVMQSVMEEKTNRIAEIIVSSIKPFQLMLGKIIGVALVGLTQFALWIVFIGILWAVLLGIVGSTGGISPELAQGMAQDAAMAQGAGMPSQTDIELAIAQISSVNWTGIILWFLFYFLGGYFVYASLFAAVGSLVNEDAQESQSLTVPITLPIVLGFFILTSAINNPNSGIAVFGSIFPLTSPIVMMGRISYGFTDELMWHLAISAVLLIGAFFLSTWVAAKIYRTGILLYGKKVTLKEVGKWLFQKQI